MECFGLKMVGLIPTGDIYCIGSSILLAHSLGMVGNARLIDDGGCID